MEVMKVGPLAVVDLNPSVQNTDAPLEESCTNSLCEMIADLLNSILDWIKNFCGCGNSFYEKTLADNGDLYFSIDGVQHFIVAKDKPDSFTILSTYHFDTPEKIDEFKNAIADLLHNECKSCKLAMKIDSPLAPLFKHDDRFELVTVYESEENQYVTVQLKSEANDLSSQPFVRTEKMIRESKVFDFSINGKSKFAIHEHNHHHMGKVCQVITNKPFDEQFKKEDFLNVVVEYLNQNPEFKLIVMPEKTSCLGIFEHESRLEREEDFTPETGDLIAVFSLAELP